jgi:phage terminase large subunit GpA-like protein
MASTPTLTLKALDGAQADWRERLFRRFEPPLSLKLAEWAESNIVLPAGQSARSGAFKNWPYMREILDAIGAPTPEFVTLMKPSRVGFTKALMIAIGATVMIDPCPIGLLVPVDDDARDYATDEIEPLFESSPALRGLMISGRIEGRNTLTRKRFVGGASLKILSARAPRNLRRHDFKFAVRR